MDYDRTVVERFESHVDHSGEHHIWTGSRNPQRGTGKLEVDGKQVTAHRRAWELAYGPLPAGAVVLPCAEQPLCVRLEHLRLAKGGRAGPQPPRQRGSKRVQVQVNGVRVHRRVRGGRGDVESTKAVLREQLQQATPQDHDATRWTLDDLLDRYIVFLEGQGREVRTRLRYADAKKNWVSPVIGSKPVRRVSADDIDRCFARMRKAGRSTSSMNQAKALLSGGFKWARRTGKVLHNPMLGFQLPKSSYVPKEKLPPEAADISTILNAAQEHTPDIAPLLTLAATTGARLGELLALRVNDIDWDRETISVWAATDVDGSLKSPKRSQHRRHVPVDEATLDVLRHQADDMAVRAALVGVPLVPEPFLFSDEPDCSVPVRPGVVTRRLGVLKGQLGVEDKRPETVASEDEALRLRRSGQVDRSGRPGPRPAGGAAMSYDDIAKALGRTAMWARRACDAALRREQVGQGKADFNLSFNGLRKFTSSELLDAGFNISVVAQRQGHGTQVLAKHYSKARESAQRKAAEYLGQVVHGAPQAGRDPGAGADGQ